MKEKNQLFTFSVLVVIVISYFSVLIPISTATTPPTHYTTPQSVKYSVEVNFTISDTAPPSNYYEVMMPRFDNRAPTSPMWHDTPPYQESNLLYHDISTYDPSPYVWVDRFNNTYDYFNKSSLDGTLRFSQHYNITLNEVIFSNITDSDIGEYDWNDNVFNLYCNTTDEFYNITDPDLIYASNNASGISPTDNLIEKAQKIYNWVSNYLTYDDSLVDEMGASWAYDNHRGDCSEYSSLMITLLRIQHIPARKVTGYVISNNPSFRPSVGKQFNFFFNSITGDGNLLGHAWVEYYVENIGWIPADPTWAGASQNYFNRIDYLRFTDAVGANWTIPWSWNPASNNPFSEFPLPCINRFGSPSNIEYQMKVTVLEVNLNPDNFMMIIIIAVIIGVVVVVSALIFLAVKRSKNKVRYAY